MRHPEWQFQKTAYVFLSKALPPGSEIQSNDTSHHASRAARMGDSARGIKAAWPDMVCVVAGFPEIYIELKAGRGDTSDNQESRGARLQALGRHWFVAWTLEDIERELTRIGVPLAARTGALIDLSHKPKVKKAAVRRPLADKPSRRALAHVAAMRTRTMF